MKNKIQIPVILINCGKEIKRPFNIAPTLAARDCGGGNNRGFIGVVEIEEHHSDLQESRSTRKL